MNIKKTSHSKIAWSILLVSIGLFIILNYGSIGMFMYQSFGVMEKYERHEPILEGESIYGETVIGVSGFYALGIVISKISNIKLTVEFFLS